MWTSVFTLRHLGPVSPSPSVSSYHSILLLIDKRWGGKDLYFKTFSVPPNSLFHFKAQFLSLYNKKIAVPSWDLDIFLDIHLLSHFLFDE